MSLELYNELKEPNKTWVLQDKRSNEIFVYSFNQFFVREKTIYYGLEYLTSIEYQFKVRDLIILSDHFAKKYIDDFEGAIYCGGDKEENIWYQLGEKYIYFEICYSSLDKVRLCTLGYQVEELDVRHFPILKELFQNRNDYIKRII